MTYIDPLMNIARGQQFVDNLFTQRSNRRAGQRLQQGDYRGATNELFASGNIDGGRLLQAEGRQQQAAERQQQTEAGLRVVRALREAQGRGQDVGQAFDSYSPMFSQLGLDQQTAQQIRGVITTEGGLDQIERLLGQEAAQWTFRDGGAGDVVGVRVTPTGQIETQLAYDAPDRPISTPYGIILPPGASGSAVPNVRGEQPVTGPASISDGPLWQNLETQESGGRQFDRAGNVLTSPAGAFGVAQLMPETARELAPRLGVNVEELYRNPDLNRRAGQLYLQDQQEKYGSTALALAAYNAGPGRVDQWLRQIGDPRTGQISEEEWISRIPFAETRAYVGNILSGTAGAQGQVEQGSEPGPTPTQDLGGGWSLQPLQTNADRRAERAEQRAERADARADRTEDRLQSAFEDRRGEQRQAESARAFSQENTLRTGYANNSSVKALSTVRPQVGLIGDIASRAARGEQISAQDDLALIFAYMKILDPDSVVREGEFANAQNTGGIPDRVVNAYNNALRGTRLNDTQRSEFFRSANRVIQQYQAGADASARRQRELAASYGLDPDRVAPDPGARTQRQSEGPRTRFQRNDAQEDYLRRFPQNRSVRLGERGNPYFLNPRDPGSGLANVPRGSFFVGPDGQLRGPKP